MLEGDKIAYKYSHDQYEDEKFEICIPEYPIKVFEIKFLAQFLNFDKRCENMINQ